jgi:hypothetical protein
VLGCDRAGVVVGEMEGLGGKVLDPGAFLLVSAWSVVARVLSDAVGVGVAVGRDFIGSGVVLVLADGILVSVGTGVGLGVVFRFLRLGLGGGAGFGFGIGMWLGTLLGEGERVLLIGVV